MPRRQQPGPAVAAAVVVVALVGVVLPIALAVHFGATGIARNDDWSYLRTLFHWVDTGHLDFNNWVSMILLGQLVLAAPLVEAFGHDITAMQVLVVLLGFGGLLAVLWLGVVATGRIGVATAAALVTAACPLWGPLAVSFMTDIPAFTASVVACAVGARAVARRRVSMPFLVAALLVACAGFTVRQYTVVPFVALVLVGGWCLRREGDRRRFRTLVVVALVLLVAIVVVFAYWRTIPNVKSLGLAMPDGYSVRATLYTGSGLLRLLGLLLAPLLVLVGPVRVVRRAWDASRTVTALVGSGVVLALVFTGLRAPRIALAGNYVLPNGVLGNGVLDGWRPEILPAGGWNLLVAIGTVGALLLAIAVVPAIVDLWARIRARDLDGADPVVALLGLVVVGYAGAYLAASLVGLPVTDRYVLSVLPLAAVLLGRRVGLPSGAPGAAAGMTAPAPERLHVAGAVVGFVFLLGVGTVFAADSASFDGTRWEVADAAVRAGWPANRIRGGFEWTSFHAAGPHGSRRPPPCVVVHLVTRGAQRRGSVIASGDYESPLAGGGRIVAVRTRNPCPERAGGP